MKLNKAELTTFNKWNQLIGENNGKITFDEELHKYTYEGQEMKSVSYRCEYVKSKFFLNNGDSQVVEDAKMRGTAVHKITELMDTGNTEELKTINVDHPDLKGYVDAYKSFLEKENFGDILWVEQRICVPAWETAGTIDRVYLHRTKEKKLRLVIVDIKTGAQKDSDFLQLWNYGIMLKKVLRIQSVPLKKLLYLKKNGSYKIKTSL